jgi:hypothetical protein
MRPLGVESKKDIGALKIDICILSNNRVAVLYAAVTRNSARTRMHSELAPANATKTLISVDMLTGGSTSFDTGEAQAIQ